MKRKFLWALTGLWLSTFFNVALATLDQIVQKTGREAVIGVAVKDVTTGHVIYQHNANRLFVPASSLKVYTAAAALIMLGPNFRFPTNVYTDAPSLTPGVLHGNLYVTFSGDPTLTSSDLVEVLSILQKKSITQIQGNIILVPPLYTAEKYPPGAVKNDRLHPYGAPITPVIVDQNAITFIIHTTRPGQLASVSVADPSNHVRITNSLYTKRPQTRACSLSYHLDEQNQFNIHGCVIPRSAPYPERVPISNPMSYAEGVVGVGLKHWGVNVQGQIISNQTMPSTAKLLNSHTSAVLPQILADTLKPSNNVFANALYLKVGQIYWRKMATWENSGLAVKQILEKYAGVPMSSATLMDGAGLSRLDRVSPIQTIELLSYMEQKFQLSDDFISALPVPGEKGTMVHRHIMRSQEAQSHIHAKTGTMKGIVGLTGYLPSTNHHALVFSIITNSASNLVYSTDQVYLPLWKYRGLEDEICRYLMNANV